MSRLTADCSRCCGLCCIVPAYLAEQGFPYDKSAEMPCRHLSKTGSCAIHEQREPRGFGACVRFDCYGAGQWVTALFGAARWQDAPELRAAMAQAYRYWLPRYSTAAVLEAALPLVDESGRQTLRERIEALCTKAPTDEARLPSAGAMRREALQLIRALLGNNPAAGTKEDSRQG